MKNITYIVLILVAFSNVSCDKVEHPYPPVSDFDTTLYPGIWSDYEATIWPTFTANPNTLRNVLIEDFTGHKCIFCPLAAVIGEDLVEANPGRVFVASVHASPTGVGSFQELHAPLYTHDFTNPEGLEIGKYFGTLPGSAFVGNPWGAISRFPENGQNTITPNDWTNETNKVLALALKVNLQAKLNYYDQTRGFYLHTEVEKLDQNLTNELAQVVYLIEDSIVKPQAFPGNVDSINYVHHNVMRACIDGKAFGKTLSDADKNPTSGKYYLNYSYKLPSQYNADNMHVLVYVFDKVTYEIYQVISVSLK